MTTINEIFSIPERVHQGDFVLKLTDGVVHPEATLGSYVVTPQLAKCFEQAMSLVKSGLDANTSKGAYLHGSFGSGKSHFMAVLTLLLQNNPTARSVPELAGVVSQSNAWTEGRKFLVVPYHMIGARSLEAGILDQYAKYVAKVHPDAPTPGFYLADALFRDAQALRARMGDEAFFAALGSDEDSGWGSLASWDAETFDAALSAPATSDDRTRLVGKLVDTFFQQAKDLASHTDGGFVSLDEGLSIMSKHAQSLGYDAVILFLDELILWLASHASDIDFVNREGQKVAKLVEAQSSERPIPIVSFIARQRDLRELVGEHLPGAEQLGFADVLTWWNARFDEITLEDRNLPAIAEKRVLKPKSEEARRILDEAFAKTAKAREEIMSTLLTRNSNQDDFRKLYPFSPALVRALVSLSSVLQRERTALKLMIQLLVNKRDTLEVGEVVPVGDLFDVIQEGAEPFSKGMRLTFETAVKLYEQKLKPMLEEEHQVTAEAVADGTALADVAKRFTNDARLIKTLILASLAPDVEVLGNLTPLRLAALNHGTIKSPIAGQEAQIVLRKFQAWAARVGEIKISGEGPNPTIALQLSGVDTDAILENAKSADNTSNRIAKIKELLFEQFKEVAQEGFFNRKEILWRGTRRTIDLTFANVREMTAEALKTQSEGWRVVIDYPFDRDDHGPKDDRAKVLEVQESGEATRTLVWLPSFFNRPAMEDLGKLVVIEYLLQGTKLQENSANLTQLEREQARLLLDNQRQQLRQRIINCLLEGYGIAQMRTNGIDHALELDEHYWSLMPGFKPQPPVGSGFQDCLQHLCEQALDHDYPDHPRFETEIKRPSLKRVLEVVLKATQEKDGRIEVDRTVRDEMRKIAVPLKLGAMGETHFVLGDEWKSFFTRKCSEKGIAAPSVRQLREWLDEPQPRGLSTELQNLSILVFAAQTNRIFHMNGVTVTPSMEDLQNAYELREQALPDEETWRVAASRAANLFGSTVSSLPSATNVAKLIEELKAKPQALQMPVSLYLKELQTRLAERRLQPSDSARHQTAQAAHGLLSALSTAGKDAVVETFAKTPLNVPEAALAVAMAKAEALHRTLEGGPWSTFELLTNVPEEKAKPVFDLINEALRCDEHVHKLSDKLKEAERLTHRILKELIPPPPPPAPPLPKGKKRQVVQPRQEKVAMPAAEAATLLMDLVNQLKSAPPETEIDITWAVYQMVEAK